MFEGVIAGLLNRFLGKYVQDLDTENLNVGIFSGNVNLTDLKLKPEALYELNLPIDVKIGTIGQISLTIPWAGLYTQSVIVNIEDVLLLVGPAISNNFFDGEREKRLIRAAKKKILQDLEAEGEVLGGPQNFFENLLTTIVNNVQIFFRNIHIRYEDTLSTKGSLACGLCLQSLSIETTNNRWKPSMTPQGANTVYQMMKVESLSFYWNPNAVVLDDEETRSITQTQFLSWRHYMITGLETFSMHREDFEFLLKPITCKVKVIINRSGEARVPRLLVDAVLHDSAAQLSRKQYLSVCSLVDSFKRIAVNRQFRHLHPKVPVIRNSKKWWKYVYDAVIEQRVKPYTWQSIKAHRENYHRYKDVYKRTLSSPNDTELKLDLQKCEDNLAILSVVIAREHAKIELLMEDPAQVEVKESEIDWWRISTPSPIQELSSIDSGFSRRNVDLCVKPEKVRGLWSHLSSPEKQRVCELIGYVEGGPKPDKPKLYIEHKINFTLANASLSLMNRGREVLVMTLTQFLASIETRPAAKAFKVSARAESIVIEVANGENDLSSIVTADNVFSGHTNQNFLSIDFEKNPLNCEADFGLNCSLEPVEIVYNEHGISEIINFFQMRSMAVKDVTNIVSEKLTEAAGFSKSLLNYTIARHKIININMDLKGPYIVLPETGSLYKGGHVLVVDLGRVVVKSDLQPSNNQLEDATCMELEERLYDRIYADCSSLQVFFCDSGDDWRNARKLADSDLHLVPKIRLQLVFSNSIKQDYKLLPKHKLNITISSIKLNLSDRRIGLMWEFFENLPLPTSNTVPLSAMDCVNAVEFVENAAVAKLFVYDRISADLKLNQLASLKRKIVLAYLYRNRAKQSMCDKAGAMNGFTESDKSFVSVEHSDDDAEIWARTVDLPGFDDNVSPNNYITVLLRFVIGEAVLHLSRSSDTAEKPYMMLRLGKVCVDMALMKYGPALQISLQSLMLSDKLHQGISGEYLELITTDASEEIVNVLYRKVRADCPDFKTHFHSVEQSLVADIGNLTLVLHQEAWQTLFKYMEYIFQKVQSRDSIQIKKIINPHTQTVMDILNGPAKEAPIPPGATKFSYSFRLSQLRVKLSHSDIDLLDIKLGGLESDCVFKANERMILKVFLNTLTIDDLSEMTLYSKMMWVDEDKVLEMKYVRHSPRVYRNKGKDNLVQCDDVKSDGSLRIYFGRLHIVLLYKLIIDLQHFMEPFIPTGVTNEAIKNAERGVETQLSNMKSWQTRLHVSIEVHAPVFLLPQKSTSPNLIVFNMGDFTVENFFKEISHNVINSSANENSSKNMTPVIDNMLVKLDSVTLSRAVMTLAGSLEVQEPILEPVSIRFDIKRAVGYHNIIALQQVSGTFQKDILLYDISASMETVNINLGQRDLSTLLAVWTDNLTEGRYVGSMGQCIGNHGSPIETTNTADASVKKLQAFFAQTESLRKEAMFRFTLDGIELKIFSDVDEVLSSPVRDCNTGLAKLAAGETSFQLDYFTDRSLDVKASLQSLLIEDIRPDTSIVIKKMFQSHGGEMRVDSTPISVSTPPIIDLTFRQNQSGDRNIDVHVEKTRLNFSVPFFMNLGRFVLDALPGDKSMDGGVINHGYVGDSTVIKQESGTASNLNRMRPPSSADSTSGYFSTGVSLSEDANGLSISIQFRKPEIMFFSDLSKTAGHALLFRTEVLIDYSRHAYRENFTLSLSGLQIMSKLQSKLKSTQPYLVLHPCDIEFAKQFKNIEEGIIVTASISPIDMHISETTVRTVTDIVEDIIADLTVVPDEKEPFNFLNYSSKAAEKLDSEELWAPKKITPYVSLNSDETNSYTQPQYPSTKPSETFTMAVPSIRIMFELEAKSRIPVLMAKSILEVTVHDWSKQMHSKCEFNLQASYYNEKLDTWEPLIEPIVCEENVYRPWEVLIKVFQAKSYPISSKLEHDHPTSEVDGDKSKFRQAALQKKSNSDSETSADENEDGENGMTFIRHRPDSKGETDNSSAAYGDDYYISSNRSESDSENEDGAMEKLASAISHLFTGDSSDGENSESDESSGAEPSGVESEAISDRENSTPFAPGKIKKSPQHHSVADSAKKPAANLNFAMKAESIDSGLEAENVADKTAIYIMIDSRDILNITLTSQSLQVLYDLLTHFTQKSLPVTDYHNVMALEYENPINLINDIGPGAKIELISHAEMDIAGNDRVLAFAHYDKDYSCPSSPANSLDGRNLSSTGSDHDWETFEGGFNCEMRTPTPQPMFSPSLSFPMDPVSLLYKKVTDERLVIKIPDFENLTVVCPQRTVNKMHALQPSKNNTRYYIMLNTDNKYKNRKIVLRSPLQIRNETSYPIGLFYKKADLEVLNIALIGEQTNPFEGTMRIHILEPDETYSIPLYVAYHCKLYLQPTYVDNYHVTTQGLWWPDLLGDLNTASNICCMPKEDKDPTVFSLRVLTTEGCRTNKSSHTIPNFLIRLLPPLTIHNRLPYAVEIKVPHISHQVRVEAGEKSNVYHMNLSKSHRVSVDVNYLSLPWTGGFNLNNDLEEKTLAMTTDCDTDGGNKQLGLNIKIERAEGCELFLHAPYWIINKTGLPLQLRGSLSDVVYECVGSEPLLFQYRRSMRRRRVRLRVYQSSWSSAFGLETVGASGLIVCKHRERNRRYRILMTVSLSQLCPQLTRIITLLPYFLVTNETKKHLRFMEENERADLWIDLIPGQCVAFWPETDSMRLHCKLRDSSLVSQHFPITTTHFTVLRMDKGTAISVDVTGGIDKPFTVTFRAYRHGDAPVRIDNLCEDIFLKLNQNESGQVTLLSPNQSTLYTWDDPSKDRVLFWNVYNNKGKGFNANFIKDGYGEERVSFHTVKHSTLTSTNSVTSKLSSTLKKLTPKSPEPESSSDEESDTTEVLKTPVKTTKPKKAKVTVYWVSYLDNYQRVFMLTQEERIAYQYRQKIDSEKCNYELFLSMSGFGLSVCMQTSMGIKELSYISLTDSPTKWEVNVAHKWKLLTVDLTSWIEERFKSDQRKCQLKEYIHIDFDKMQMTKPFFGELRRTYRPALWMQVRKSDSQMYTHIKLHRLQIDNQLYEAVFPSVLYPAPLPTQIAKKMGTRPCIEYVSLKRNRPYCNQEVYKYIKLLVQEFCLQLDRGFVNYVFDIMNQWTVEEKPALRLRADLALVHVPITNIASKQINENCKTTVIEYMHLSPMKVRLSLSSRGYSKENIATSPNKSTKKENRPKLFNSDLLEFLFNSWSSCLTEMKGVKLKMAYFEISGKSTSFYQLYNDAYLHYYNQLIQQFYVLILGLDILGNPYGKIADFTRGLGEFFYEPSMGVADGPEEIANRLAFGASSLFGHSVGGVAKTSSLLAQSLGELMSTLSFDEEYKKKRRYGYCLQKSSDLPESLILASQTYVMGVALGLSGIIMKPFFDDENHNSGGRNECVEGVVRGCGGYLSAAGARGTGGASLALGALRRAADRGRPLVLRARLPRHCHPLEGIKPYSTYQALGLRLLASLGRGHYVDTDLYLAHASLTPNARVILLLTLQQIFLIRTGNSGGPWQTEWTLRMDDVIGVPIIHENKLIFNIKQDDSVNYFSKDVRTVECEDVEVLQWLQAKVESALILNMEDKPCPTHV